MDELKEYSGLIDRTNALSAELDILLLRLRRQVLWLRHRWREAPGERYQALAVSDREADMVAAEGHRWDERAAFFRENSDAAFLTGLLHEGAVRESEPSPMASLQSLFNLSAFEKDILLLSAAVEMVPGLERLYAYVQDDAGLMLPTPAMAMSLLFDTWDEAVMARDVFHPAAPLFRHDLMEWAAQGRGGILTRPFRINERVLGYLTGSREPDCRIAEVVSPVYPARIPAGDIWPRECALLEDWIKDSLKLGRCLPLLVNLVGREDVALKGVAAEVCSRVAIPLLYARFRDFHGLAIPPARAVQLFFREALLRNSAVYMDIRGDEAGETQEMARFFIQQAKEYAPLTFIFTGKPWPPAMNALPLPDLSRTEFRLPLLDHARRLRLWERGLRSMATDGDSSVPAVAKDLANRFQFDADGITAVIERAAQAAGLDDRLALLSVENACRDVSSPGLEGLAVKASSSFAWEDIVLPADAVGQLREIADQFRLRHKVYGEWGFGRKLDRGRGICVLFSGPSGTGKTMAAEILANDLGLSLYRIDLSGVVNKYIGETEKNLRRVFDEGERCQALLFFDEADALFGKRSEVRDSHDRYANIEVNYLLQRMEAYTGASILATNMRSAIDSAFMRRLRYIVEFPMPDASLREVIWRKSFPPEAAVDGIDFRFLAKQFTISGGNIRGAALNAAFLAAADDRSIGMGHVVRAVKREYAKLGRLCVEAEFGKYL